MGYYVGEFEARKDIVNDNFTKVKVSAEAETPVEAYHEMKEELDMEYGEYNLNGLDEYENSEKYLAEEASVLHISPNIFFEDYFISEEMIKEGIYKSVITFAYDGDGDEPVCHIGDYWFYCVSDEDFLKYGAEHEKTITSVWEALEELSCESPNEYAYYNAFLRENGILGKEQSEKGSMTNIER